MNRMNHHIVGYIMLLVALCLAEESRGQAIPSHELDHCESRIGNNYVSDGQEYLAKLNKNNKARFHTTFYGGSQYRIVACSNIEHYPLIMKVYDSERNLLFDNTQHDNTPDWHLAFTSTVSCVIEINVDAEAHIDKLVKLLIGFKRNQHIQQKQEP